MSGALIPQHRMRSVRSARSVAGRVVIGFALLCMSMFTFGCSDDDGSGPVIRNPEDFLPQSVGDMTRDGNPLTATTATELQGHINGGYEVYVENNFQDFAWQAYQGTVGGGQATVDVWIFELATADDARALYDEDDHLCGALREELNGIGEQGELCFNPNEGSRVIFQRGKYWVRIYVNNNTQDAKDLVELFATHIDSEIGG